MCLLIHQICMPPPAYVSGMSVKGPLGTDSRCLQYMEEAGQITIALSVRDTTLLGGGQEAEAGKEGTDLAGNL